MRSKSVSLTPQVERLIRSSQATIVKYLGEGDFSLALNLIVLGRFASVLSMMRNLPKEQLMEFTLDYIDGTREITSKDIAEYTTWIEKITLAYSERRLKRVEQTA